MYNCDIKEGEKNMNTYAKEFFENGLYRIKHIAGVEAYNSEKKTYQGNGILIFSYYIKGTGSIVIDSTRHEISGGELFIMKPTEFFRHKMDDNCFSERIVLILYPQIFKSLPGNYSDILFPFLKRKNGEKNRIPCRFVNELHLDKLFMELLDHSREDSPTERILALSGVLEILAVTNRIITQVLIAEEQNVLRNSKAEAILKYLNCNYTNDISITDVANHFHLDRSYISRLFKAHMGMTMQDYIIMRRIYLFNYLIENNNSLEETAYRVGFKNYSNFYRLYEKYMQIAPSEFKKSLYNSKNIASTCTDR